MSSPFDWKNNKSGIVDELKKKRQYPDIDKFWAHRIESLRKRQFEAWAALIEAKKDRGKIQEVLVLLDKELERAYAMAGIKLTNTNPEDLVGETYRIIVEGIPDRKKFNEAFKDKLDH